MPKTIENKKGYKPNAMRYSIKLEVEVILDGVPGTFDQLEDHIQHMLENPYFVSVTVPDEHVNKIEAGWQYKRHAAA